MATGTVWRIVSLRARYSVGCAADFLKRLDQWRRRQIDKPSRAEAIRRLVNVALEASGKRSR
jgi:hypothetical protein